MGILEIEKMIDKKERGLVYFISAKGIMTQFFFTYNFQYPLISL